MKVVCIRGAAGVPKAEKVRGKLSGARRAGRRQLVYVNFPNRNEGSATSIYMRWREVQHLDFLLSATISSVELV
jgi:hypothetical protein